MVRKRQEKQHSLPGFGKKSETTKHGGELAKGKRKTRRPFDPKQALHVVLRSSKARGERSLLSPRHCDHIRGLVDRLKKRWRVSVYRYANVGNHLHLLIRAHSRADWQGFIRELAGGIAMLVTGARKGHALARSRSTELPESAQRGFWDHLVFTRIVRWGRDFATTASYVSTNLWEGLGAPIRKLLARGIICLSVSDDGAVFVHQNAPPEVLAALKPRFRTSAPA